MLVAVLRFEVRIGAKEVNMGRLLQKGNLLESGSRSKASRKGKVAPNGKFNGERK